MVIEDSQLTGQCSLPYWCFTLHNTGLSSQLIAHTQLLLLFLYFLRNIGLEFRNESFKQPRKPTASQISSNSEHTLIPGTLAALSHQVGASNFETNRTPKENEKRENTNVISKGRNLKRSEHQNLRLELSLLTMTLLLFGI